MNKSNILFKATSLLLVVLALLSVKGIQAQSNNVVTIKQPTGDVQVKKNPKRVVVLDLGSLETCYELGIPVVGVLANVKQFMPEYGDATKYTVAGNVPKANIATVAQLKPDLIITSNRQRAQHDSLAMIAPTLLFGTETENFWSTFEANVRSIASIFEKEKLAGEKLAALRKKKDLVKAKAKADPKKTVVAMHINGRFNPSGPNSRFGFAYDVLDLKPAYTPEPAPERESAPQQGEQTQRQRVQAPSLESINPDYLFVFDRATGIKGEMPVWTDLLNDDVKKTKAYKNNKVFLLPGSIWYLSGSGLLSVNKKITDIGEKLYGIKF
ncbi:ABC transporter substrate-binding protein [Sphingobacterium corticibacterium]|uniref:Fe/B12 periplasmic-binding domain-containing protein n=1 Tax=Sphingobacterium corticibacterium TaxID=2484746 RepID=A0A4Q6XKY0_9SPHI|nr:ABC transporter substrate-binding protein [Sphingobacterium corticibacterium]RZF57442.1 hypothetical protein EWE74_20680 [Sphingobacterium corticibacterium]